MPHWSHRISFWWIILFSHKVLCICFCNHLQKPIPHLSSQWSMIPQNAPYKNLFFLVLSLIILKWRLINNLLNVSTHVLNKLLKRLKAIFPCAILDLMSCVGLHPLRLCYPVIYSFYVAHLFMFHLNIYYTHFISLTIHNFWIFLPFSYPTYNSFISY